MTFETLMTLAARRRAKAGVPNPAAQMGAEVFYNAAKRAGLPTDNGTLNKIVRLVSAGMDVSQAAQEVKRTQGAASLRH